MKRLRGKTPQGKLAAAIGKTTMYISNIENGKSTCMPEHLTKICQIFNVSADYFYFEMDKKLNVDNNSLGNILSILETCSEFDIERISKMIEILLAKPAA